MEREAVRIDVVIPLGVTLITEREAANLKARIVGDMPLFSYIPLKDTMDEALNNWLKMLNAKLDYLINLLTCEKEGFTKLPLRKVNLSEKGLRFVTDKAFPMGSFVEIKMVLDLYQVLGFYLYGWVIRSEKKDDGYEIGIEFSPMPPDIREKLSFYILQKEREIIRQMRGY